MCQHPSLIILKCVHAQMQEAMMTLLMAMMVGSAGDDDDDSPPQARIRAAPPSARAM